MTRDKLINDIVQFCYEYDVIDKGISEDEIKSIVYHKLDEPDFIEDIINTIIKNTRTRNDIDVGKIIALLIELEKIRLELEYKDYVTT